MANVNERILFILRKVVFLTILYEILAVFDVIPHFIIFWAPKIQFYNIFAFSLDSVLGSLLMLLMIERNNDKYIEFIKYMNGTKMLCCCRICSDNIALPNPHVHEVGNSSPGPGIFSMDTKTPQPVEFKIKKSPESEITITGKM